MKETAMNDAKGGKNQIFSSCIIHPIIFRIFRSRMKMNSRGMTLIEIMVVIVIISILVIALGLEFRGWIGSYKVESQIKNIYVDLMNARARAMQRNRTHFVRLISPTSYSIYEDDSDGVAKVIDGDGLLQPGAGVTADTQLPSFPKTVEFPMDWDNAAIAAPEDITFIPRGTIANLGTIRIFVDRNGNGEKDFIPDYDCIVIAQARINLGRTNGMAQGGNCDIQ